MKVESLSDIYASLEAKSCTVHVVPQIRYDYSDSDYLYQLYKPLADDDTYNIQSLSFLGHIKFVIHALFNSDSILHYHWLEFQDLRSLLGMPWKLMCISLFNLLGGKIVWTIHNIEPHDKKWLALNFRIQKWMAKIADRVQIHCESCIHLVSNKFNVSSNKISIVPHPSFPSKIIPRTKSIAVINKEFGVTINMNKPTLLFFGNISKYKRIEEVLDIIDEEALNIQSLVVGTFKKGQETLGSRLLERSIRESNINVVPHFIEDEYIPYFFGASSLCVFNFEQILTSGSVLMAHSYEKEIIAPNLGCLTELYDKENVHLFSSETELRELLKTVISTLDNE